MPDLKIKIGDPVPDFELPDHTGKKIRFSSLKGSPVAIFVYPEADTPGCTKQACGFRDDIASFAKAGVKVFGLSNDEPAANAAFKAKYSLPYDLLCDVDTKVTTELGLYGPQEWKGKKYDGLTRSTLLIDANGRLKSVLQGIPAQDHASEILKALG